MFELTSIGGEIIHPVLFDASIENLEEVFPEFPNPNWGSHGEFERIGIEVPVPSYQPE